MKLKCVCKVLTMLYLFCLVIAKLTFFHDIALIYVF